jgi:TP901 family phage tail tape measure protein
MAELQVVIAAVNRASTELRRLSRDLKGLDQAATGKGVAGLNSEMSTFGRLSRNFGRDVAGIAAGFVGAQAAITGFQSGLRGTVGAAISFESSFAGIRKTVDATEEEFTRLAKANRDMARTIPATADNINRVGELAGQLGVSGVDNIIKFERTIVDLANTTNLTAESAAESFAQIANVVQLPIDQIDRLGSAIVDLGNKSAATESGIVDFTTRISGAGKIAGLQAAEIAGIGAAFASVGVEAEAGGTAIQKVLIEMTKAASQGGDALQTFAEVTGLTAEQFQSLAKSDPAEAFTRFVEELGRAGDRAFDILENLELGDQRLIRSFLSAAGAGDLLRRSIETGTTAFEQNTALTAEAEKRYATTAAQLQVLKNNVVDAGISIGNALLPAIGESAEAANGLVDAAKPLGPALKVVATAAPAAAAGMLAFAAASKAANFAQLQGDLAVLTKAGFPNLARQAAGTTTIMHGLGAALRSPTGGFIALTAAIAGVEIASRKLTGFGIIDHFTGAAEAARKAARFTELYGDSLERVAALERAGISAERARTLEIERTIDAISEAASVIDEFRTGAAESPLEGFLSAKLAEDDIKGLTDSLRDLSLTREELRSFRDTFAEDPAIFEALTTLINEQIAALGGNEDALRETGLEAIRFQNATRGTADALVVQGDAMRDIGVLATALGANYDALDGSIQRVNDTLSRDTAADRQLQAQIDLVQAQIDAYEAAGQEIPADLQKMHDQLTANQTAAQSLERAAVSAFGAMAASLVESGAVSQKTIDEIATTISALPQEKAIKIIAEAQQFLDSAAEVQKFIDIVKRNPRLDITVALKIASLSDEIAAQQAEPRRLGSRADLGPPQAEGGLIKKHQFVEVGEGNKPELILPLSKPDRTRKLLKDAGLLAGSFKEGGLLGLVRGQLPFPSAAKGGGGDGASVSDTANEFAALADAINASGQSAVEFIARLELHEEQAAAVAEAERIAAESAARSAIDLTKLGIALGEAGISGAAFVAQQELEGLRKAFLESGLSLEQFIDHINGFTADLMALGRSVNRRTGKPVNIYNTGPIGTTENGVRRTAAGAATDEGLDRLRRRGLVPDDVPVRRYDPQEDFNRRVNEAREREGQVTTNNYYGPVNNYEQMSRRQYRDEEALMFR